LPLICIFVLQLISLYGSAEGSDEESGHLEALLTEGDTDKGHAPDSTKDSIDHSDKGSNAEEEPKHVTEGTSFEIGSNSGTEVVKRNARKLEPRPTEGDTDDSDAKKHTDDEINDSHNETTQKSPENITKSFHII
jgi:hypothetical protein